MFSFANKQLSIGEIWSASFKLYFNSISKVWYLVMALSGVSVVLGLIFIHCGHMLPSKGLPEYVIITTLIMIFFMSFLTPVALCRMYAVATDQPTNLQIFFSYVSKFYGKVVFTTLITLFLIILAAMVVILPGIFLSILLSMSIPCILFDNVGVFGAIKLSSKLVWGRWWRVFAILFPFTIGYLAVDLILQIVANDNVTLTLLLKLIANTILQPFLYALLLNLYNDCKLRQLIQMEVLTPNNA